MFLTMGFRALLNSIKKPREITKKRSKCIWQVMEKILLRVSSPSFGGLSEDHVVMCHLFFELDKFSAAFFSPYSFIDLSGDFDQERSKQCFRI